MGREVRIGMLGAIAYYLTASCIILHFESATISCPCLFYCIKDISTLMCIVSCLLEFGMYCWAHVCISNIVLGL